MEIKRKLLFIISLIINNACAIDYESSFQVKKEFLEVAILFDKPAYAAMFYENCGFILSKTQKIEFLNPGKISIGPIELIHDGKNDKKYNYIIKSKLFNNLNEVNIPVTIKLHENQIDINVKSEIFKIVPEKIRIQVDSKMRAYLSENSQDQIIICYKELKNSALKNNVSLTEELLFKYSTNTKIVMVDRGGLNEYERKMPLLYIILIMLSINIFLGFYIYKNK